MENMGKSGEYGLTRRILNDVLLVLVANMTRKDQPARKGRSVPFLSDAIRLTAVVDESGQVSTRPGVDCLQ